MTLYRKTVWFLKGLREYTKNGYISASQQFSEEDLNVDCEGKVFMITGANSGIGESLALQVAKRGGEIHMVCRNLSYAESTRTKIIKETNNQRVHVHILDLAKPQDVYKFAKDFRDQNEKLDVLVNNAGCMVHERLINADGVDYNFATNVLSPHILTKVLSSLLLKSPQGRVILVSSGGMLLEKLEVNDPQLLKKEPYEGVVAYAQNKRQMVVLAEHYSQEYKNLFIASGHPGWADTPAVRSAMPDFHKRMETRLRTAEEGADTFVWLAISQSALKQPSGLFFQDRVPVSTHLPLAWTQTSKEEENQFLQYLNELMKTITSKDES